MKCIKLLITGRIITYFLVGSQVTKRGNTVYRTRQTILIYSFYHDLLQHPGLKILLLYRFLFSFPLSFYFFYNLFYAIGDTVRCNEDSLLFTRCQRYFLCQSSSTEFRFLFTLHTKNLLRAFYEYQYYNYKKFYKSPLSLFVRFFM